MSERAAWFTALHLWVDHHVLWHLRGLRCAALGHRYGPGPIIAGGRFEVEYDECRWCGALIKSANSQPRPE